MFERVPGYYNLVLMDEFWKHPMGLTMLYLGHNYGRHWPLAAHIGDYAFISTTDYTAFWGRQCIIS